jgi:hypothetical protein
MTQVRRRVDGDGAFRGRVFSAGVIDFGPNPNKFAVRPDHDRIALRHSKRRVSHQQLQTAERSS